MPGLMEITRAPGVPEARLAASTWTWLACLDMAYGATAGTRDVPPP
jgi:hypothetical protein